MVRTTLLQTPFRPTHLGSLLSFKCGMWLLQPALSPYTLPRVSFGSPEVCMWGSGPEAAHRVTVPHLPTQTTLGP